MTNIKSYFLDQSHNWEETQKKGKKRKLYEIMDNSSSQGNKIFSDSYAKHTVLKKKYRLIIS